MKEINFIEYELPNGLHVILCPDKNSRIVAVDVWYHVGSKDEDPSRTGFAHLFEHMMFQGSAHVGKAEHMSYIERAGGTFNGSTTWDRTNYFETLPSDRLELALWLEADRMSSLDISQTNLDNQREVVKEERRWRVDNRPYGTAWEKIYSLAFRVHPYRWPVVGYMNHIDAVTVEDVRSFFAKYYVPNNAVLVLAGEFEVASVKRSIEKYFSDIPASASIEREFINEPPLESGIHEIVHDIAALPAVYIAFRIPELTSDDVKALDLVAAILTEGESSRLYKRLVYEKRIAESVESFAVDMEHPGLFIVNAVVAPGHSTEEIKNAIDAELKMIPTKSIHDQEVQKVKNQSYSHWVSRNSRAMGRAENLAHFSVFHHDTAEINRHPGKIQSITNEQIRSAAEKYLSTDRRVVLDYVPKIRRVSKRAGRKLTVA